MNKLLRLLSICHVCTIHNISNHTNACERDGEVQKTLTGRHTLLTLMFCNLRCRPVRVFRVLYASYVSCIYQRLGLWAYRTATKSGEGARSRKALLIEFVSLPFPALSNRLLESNYKLSQPVLKLNLVHFSLKI